MFSGTQSKLLIDRPHITPASDTTGSSGGKAVCLDEQLVAACLEGNEEAWSALIDKYKGLIFSVPVKFGLSADGATEVFQEVCLSLLSELPKLRQPRALPAWLMRTAWHKCLHWKRCQEHYVEWPPELEKTSTSDSSKIPEQWVQEIESQQALREAIAELSPRCNDLIQMLFFETPAVPYHEIARRLGLATGSIGFIRTRCLDRLRERLQERGFR